MKVVALGAAGMGRYAARTAVTFDFVDEPPLRRVDLDYPASDCEPAGRWVIPKQSLFPAAFPRCAGA